ncbi:MAG: hypothetical protein HQM09_01280 [Candidatus Riflebacteria bacterium]|nr:hypothetical protein [Candidatus Riflebacteria bacterium]
MTMKPLGNILQTCLRSASILVLIGTFLVPPPAIARDLSEPVNFFHESGALIDIEDPVLDDKGPGWYTYPLDSRLQRGMFDLTRFSAYEEGQVVTFVIQMRTNILTRWPDSGKGEEQGFVANLFDIYLDTDGRPGSGHTKALPGRDVDFADGMGWEKVILVSPLAQYEVMDRLREKTDDPQFMEIVKDIVIPDYVQVQRDCIIVKINKEFIGNPTPDWGYQCFSMGFRRIVSPNQLFNMDVRAFSSNTDFGGGWDTYGDPIPIDLIMPEGKDQYEILREYRSQPFRNNIAYAKVPFVYGKKARNTMTHADSINAMPISAIPDGSALSGNTPVVKPYLPVPISAPIILTYPDQTPALTSSQKKASSGQPIVKPSGDNAVKQSENDSQGGFQPLYISKPVKKTSPAIVNDGFKPLPRPSGFQPLGRQ